MLAWRGHLAGPVVALGPAFYALYTSFQLAVGGDVARHPGNSERFFALHLAGFVLAGAIAMGAWLVIEVRDLPPVSRRVDRVLGWFTLVVAGFLAVGLHLPGLVDAWRDQPTGTEYLADPVVFWLVKMMDLGLVVPVLVAVGIGLLAGRDRVGTARYAVVGWIALLGSAVAGMAVVMQATQDPAASTANTIVFTTFATVAIGMALVVYRPMFRGTPPHHDER